MDEQSAERRTSRIFAVPVMHANHNPTRFDVQCIVYPDRDLQQLAGG